MLLSILLYKMMGTMRENEGKWQQKKTWERLHVIPNYTNRLDDDDDPNMSPLKPVEKWYSGVQCAFSVPWGIWPVSGSANTQRAGVHWFLQVALSAPHLPHSLMNFHWSHPPEWLLMGSYWIKTVDISAPKRWYSATTRQGDVKYYILAWDNKCYCPKLSTHLSFPVF